MTHATLKHPTNGNQHALMLTVYNKVHGRRNKYDGLPHAHDREVARRLRQMTEKTARELVACYGFKRALTRAKDEAHIAEADGDLALLLRWKAIARRLITAA